MNKECLHNWQVGYVADLVIYCTKCKKEADDVYEKKDFDYSTHWCQNGNIVKREIIEEKTDSRIA